MDNKNNIEQFDDLFKQAFDQASTTPPPGVWEAVSAGTSGATTAAGTSVIAKLASIKAAAILGSVALVVTTLVVLNQDNSELPNSEDVPSIVKTEEVVANDKKSSSEEVRVAEENGEQSKNQISNKTNTAEQNQVDPSNNPVNNLNPEGSEEGTSQVKNSGTSADGSKAAETPVDKVETVSSPFEVVLKASASEVCLNGSVEFTLSSNEKVASLAWLMDGKLLSTKGQSLRILMLKSGTHRITVSGKTVSGATFSKEQNVAVKSASAEFEFADRGNGWIDLTSNRAVATSQWYANQLLIGENKRELTYHATENEVQFVHMVTDENGCRDTAIQNYKAKDACDFEIIIRDAITPYLLDGKNDQLDIDMPEVDNYHFTVYDPSNANVIFDTKDPQVSWNGKYENMGALVPVGQYVYRLIYDCGGKTVTKRGKVEVKD